MSNPKKIIFRHGWGLTDQFWSNILPFFQSYECVIIDEGYFYTDHKPKKSESYGADSVFEIGIGHSLGFSKLLKDAPQIKYLVGLNAFVNFLGNDQEIHQIRSAEYSQFKKNFDQKPQSTLIDFYKRCGIDLQEELEYRKFNTDKMAKDLGLLALHNRIPQDSEKNIMIINSIDDLVVPRNLTEDNFAATEVRLHYLESGRHGLGYINSKRVAELILDFVA